jgi:hypothetical protein
VFRTEKRQCLELRNVSLELRNVSLELRNVSLELRNVSLGETVRKAMQCPYGAEQTTSGAVRRRTLQGRVCDAGVVALQGTAHFSRPRTHSSRAVLAGRDTTNGYVSKR